MKKEVVQMIRFKGFQRCRTGSRGNGIGRSRPHRRSHAYALLCGGFACWELWDEILI